MAVSLNDGDQTFPGLWSPTCFHPLDAVKTKQLVGRFKGVVDLTGYVADSYVFGGDDFAEWGEPLPAKGSSYRQWGEGLAAYAKREEEQLGFWLAQGRPASQAC